MKISKQNKINLQSQTLFSFKKPNQVSLIATSATCPPPTTDATTATPTLTITTTGAF
ncbi:MAG: hypothetical protein ACXVJE_14145 [Mucilaginibacter sp.]